MIVLIRAFSLLFFAGIIAGCGTVWHPKGSGFVGIRDGYSLQADYVGLSTKFAGTGKNMADELIRRGASCIVKKSNRSESKEFVCQYFFCKGNALQVLTWRFPESATLTSLDQVASKDPVYRDYGAFYADYFLANHTTCGDRAKLKKLQREYSLNEIGRDVVEYKIGVVNSSAN